MPGRTVFLTDEECQVLHEIVHDAYVYTKASPATSQKIDLLARLERKLS